MPFSQTAIQDATATPQGTDTLIAWVSSAAAGTIYQVYVNLTLAWFGTVTRVVLPIASASRIDIGTVGPGEATTNFAGNFAAIPGSSTRVRVAWDGGAFEQTVLPVAGFHVYSSDAPGGSVDYTTPVATVYLSIQGVTLDGWGMGGWGQGGWGTAGVSSTGWGQGGWGAGGWGAGGGAYTWDSGPLCPGVWTFGIKPFDTAGNEGTAVAAAAAVTGAPQPPAPNALGQRLAYTSFHLSGGSAFATLTWNTSPACS